MSAVIASAKNAGVTGIKLYADLPAPLVKRVTTEAHREGLKVWAHATLAPAKPGDVIGAGADVISHIDMLVFEADSTLPSSIRAIFNRANYAAAPVDGPVVENVLRMMKTKGTLLDATLVAVNRVGARAELDATRPHMHAMREWSFTLARRAHQIGIPFVAGTDFMGRPATDSTAALHDELVLLVTKAGLTALQAIQAATLNGARALGREREQGTIEPGKVADLVVLRADPLVDINNTRRIAYVIKGGHVHPIK
jgi:imidazolonepropionase-like amidohydrolase